MSALADRLQRFSETRPRTLRQADTGEVMTAQSDVHCGWSRRGGLRLFALDASAQSGRAIADALGHPLAAHEERDFEDGEHKARPLEDVRDADVYVMQSLHGGPVMSADDKLCRLLFFIGALKDGGAARVTAIAPYLCYARKDRRTKPGDPVTTRYVARLFEAAGVDVVLTLDVHNPAAFENAFRCQAVTLTAAPLFVAYARALKGERLCVVSPDPGGVKRAEVFREALEAAIGEPIAKGFADKHRSEGGITGDLLVGDVKDAVVLIVDDIISTGGTLLRAARAVRRAGGRRVIALVTHGLFAAGAREMIADGVIDRFAVTDAVPPFRLEEGDLRGKIDTLPVAPLIANAVRRLHDARPLDDVLVW